ncbi:hypothetical protein [Herbaspirillum sp. ST 5-3]|uniref:hypothetical protein n=1 Tax=Oxalobacteraceae TaxID=75682 RepID=UPI0010A3A009|nr:hypothetical protein [Herbaspirillum sp. ST 5-3]
MSFTFTINGHTYTSDPANVDVPDGYRFIGYGYISALGNLGADLATVAAQVLLSAGSATNSAQAANDSAITATGAADVATDKAAEASASLAATQVLADSVAGMSSVLLSDHIYFNTTTAVNKAVANRERCKVTAACTITAPAAPADNDEFVLLIPAGVTGVVIARNGSNIDSVADDFTLDVASATDYYVTVTYFGPAVGWEVIF